MRLISNLCGFGPNSMRTVAISVQTRCEAMRSVANRCDVGVNSMQIDVYLAVWVRNRCESLRFRSEIHANRCLSEIDMILCESLRCWTEIDENLCASLRFQSEIDANRYDALPVAATSLQQQCRKRWDSLRVWSDSDANRCNFGLASMRLVAISVRIRCESMRIVQIVAISV